MKSSLDCFQEYLSSLTDASPNLWTVFFNIGLIQRRKGKLKDALDCFQQSAENCKEHESPEALVKSYLQLGFTQVKLGLQHDASTSFVKAVEASRLTHDFGLRLNSLLALTLQSADTDNWDELEHSAYKAKELAKDLGLISLSEQLSLQIGVARSRIYKLDRASIVP